jgi:hypothetical protein
MLDMLEFVPFDEAELRAALDLFQIAVGAPPNGGDGSAGGGVPPEPTPALEHARDAKAIAAKMKARRALVNDGVVSTSA